MRLKQVILLQIYVTNNKMIDNVCQYLSDKMGINHIAFKVAYINEIPKTESGKTSYKDLADSL